MEDRKARLAALAARAGRTKKEAPPPEEEPAPQPVVDQDEEPSTKLKRTSLEDALSKAKQEASRSTQGESAILAPKKMNWDLKRDIQPKLDKLERRTQKAIVALLKERLEQEAADSSVNQELD